MELFTEQGFAATVPQITARAGLTTRTFFRHFTDKREVLFAGEEELPVLVARLAAEAPSALAPMTLIDHGLHVVASTRFEGQREYLRTRRTVVQGDESLRERELRKRCILSEAINRACLDRGYDELTATHSPHRSDRAQRGCEQVARSGRRTATDGPRQRHPRRSPGTHRAAARNTGRDPSEHGDQSDNGGRSHPAPVRRVPASAASRTKEPRYVVGSPLRLCPVSSSVTAHQRHQCPEDCHGPKVSAKLEDLEWLEWPSGRRGDGAPQRCRWRRRGGALQYWTANPSRTFQEAGSSQRPRRW